MKEVNHIFQEYQIFLMYYCSNINVINVIV